MNDFHKYIEIIEKAKKFPIGTIRRWGNAVYRKIAENQWELVKKLRSKDVPRYTKEGYTIDPESQMEELNDGEDEYGEGDIIYISDEEVSRISTDVASIKNFIESYKLQSTVHIPESADKPRKLFQPLYSFLDGLNYQTFQGSENKRGYLIDGRYIISIKGFNYTVTEVLDRLGAYQMRDEYLVNARVERWVWNSKKGGYSTDRVRKGLREFVLIVKKDDKTWNIKSLGRLTGEEDDSHYDELSQFFPLLFKGDNNLNNNLAFAASVGKINEIDISPSYNSLTDAQERIKGIDFHNNSSFHSQIINLSLDKIMGEGNQLDINKLNELIDGIQQRRKRINRLSIEEESERVGGGRESIAASIIAGSVEGDRNLSQEDASEKFTLSESLIKEYAQKTGVWLDKEELLKEFPGRLVGGKESQVFLDEDEGFVLKITSPYVTSPNLERFFTDHITLYNYMFPETAYMVKGFLEDEGGFKVVLTQPYIDGKLLIDRTNALTIETFSETCEIERKNIEEDLKKRWEGMERVGENDYANNRYSIDDAHLQNVIVKNGVFYYIDVNPYLVNDDYGEYDMSDNVEKSRKGDPIGTVKIWSGKEWEKTPTGWKPRSKGREKKESEGGWESPKLLGINAVAVNEFQNRVAAHVKYNGKSYAVTVLTPKEANEQGYTITPSNLQYLTSGVKKSESRDRAILSLLRRTTYSDFKALDGKESPETNSLPNNQQEKYFNEFKEMPPGDAFERYQVLANEGNKDGIEAFQKYLQEKGEPPVVDETSIEDYGGVSYKKISDEDYKKELFKIKEKSTEDQIEAIDYYVDGGNYAIRKQLDGRLNNEKVERYINTLTDYIDNPENRISKNTPLYRCIPYNSVSKEILDLNVGDEFEDKSFSSFSTQRVTDFGQGVQITLLAKKGQKIANLLNDYQNEYLAQKGSKFKIISKGYRSVVVELVDEKTLDTNPKGKSSKLVDSFSDETRNFYQEVKSGNEALSDFIDHLIDNDYPWDDIKKFVKEEWPELGETLLNGQFNYITSEKSIHKKYYNVDKKYKPISTHISIEGWSNEERANRVMAALQDIQGGVKQGTVRNPYELASSEVIKDSRYGYYKNSGNIYSNDAITLIEAVRRGEDIRFSDGWYIVEVDDDYLYVDVTGQALELSDEYRDMAMITDKFGKALENDIEKGKAVPVGTVREKNGVKWIKTPNGWKYQKRDRKKKEVEDPQNPQSETPQQETSPEAKKQKIEEYAKKASNEQLLGAIKSNIQPTEVKEIAKKELERRGITIPNGDNKEGGENSETNVSPKEKGDSLSALETLLNSSDISDNFKKKIQAEYDRMKGVKAGEDNEKLKQENDALKKENESLKKQSTLQGVDDKQYKRISNLVENSNFVSRNVKLTIDGKDASPYMTKYKGKVKFYMKDENGKKTDSFDTLDEYISAWKGNQSSPSLSTISEEKMEEQKPQEKTQSVMDEMEEEDKAAYSKELAEKQKREAAERKRRSEENRRKLNEEAAQQESQKPVEEEKPKTETQKRLENLLKSNPINKKQQEALDYYNKKLEQDNDWSYMMMYYQGKSNINDLDYRVAFQRFLLNHGKEPVVDDLLYNEYDGVKYQQISADSYSKESEKIEKSTSEDVRASIEEYTQVAYHDVRKYCVGEDVVDKEGTAKRVENLSEYIEKNKIGKNTLMYRCLKNRDGNIDKLLSLKPGMVFEDESFSSYSTEKLRGFGSDLQITLLAKKGNNVANLLNTSESEFLVQRKSRYKVITTGFNSMVVEMVD